MGGSDWPAVRSLEAPDLLAPLIDPRTALAAHEQEVGLACVRVVPVAGAALHLDDRNHQLAGALVGIVAIAVAPDVGAGLGPHLHDVLAQIAATKLDVSEISWRHRIPTVSRPAAPLEITEYVGIPQRFIFFHIQEDKGLEAIPRHLGVGARQDHLEAAWRGMIATAVHDPAAVDTGNPGGADAVVAVGRGLGVRTRGNHQGGDGGREGNRQAVKGGGGSVKRVMVSLRVADCSMERGYSFRGRMARGCSQVFWSCRESLIRLPVEEVGQPEVQDAALQRQHGVGAPP